MSTATLDRRPQHLEALDRANRIRMARAEMKRAIRAGDVDPAEIVLVPPEHAETMSAYDLVRSQVRWGRKRTLRLLSTCAIGESRQLGRLTDRQRTVLADEIRARSNQ